MKNLLPIIILVLIAAFVVVGAVMSFTSDVSDSVVNPTTDGSKSSTIYNKQFFDIVYGYDYAIISLPNGKVVEGKCQSWTDYEDGDMLQVKVNDNMYLVHSSDVALIKYG